jgi:hypothetical protein
MTRKGEKCLCVLVPTIKTLIVLIIQIDMHTVKATDLWKVIPKLNDNITNIILYKMKEMAFFTLHVRNLEMHPFQICWIQNVLLYQIIPYNTHKHTVIWAQVCTTARYTGLLTVYYACHHFCQRSFELH